MANIPPPLTSGRLCPDCKGTGADISKTKSLSGSERGHIRCWTCNGNGLDPSEYFRWGQHKPMGRKT